MVKTNRSMGNWPRFAVEQTLRQDILKTASDLNAFGITPAMLNSDDNTRYVAATGCRSNKGWLTNLVTNNLNYGFDSCPVDKIVVNGYGIPRNEDERAAMVNGIKQNPENVLNYFTPTTFDALKRADPGSNGQWVTNAFEAQLTRLLVIPMSYTLEAENGTALLEKMAAGVPAGYSPIEMGPQVFPIGLDEANNVRLEGIIYDDWMNLSKDDMGVPLTEY